MTIAIMSAMHEENASLIDAMDDRAEVHRGSRVYYTGSLCDREVVVVFSHWGKVAAAITATSLICDFDVSETVFTGVAGALDERAGIGDIVIADSLYQHDMDARPIIEQHEIPLLGRASIRTTDEQRHRLTLACEQFVAQDFERCIEKNTAAAFGISVPSVMTADIASGDQFVSEASVSDSIRQRLPTVACVEMEGAAVAQVCESFDLPFALVRTISDGANESSELDFQSFISNIAREYSLGIVKRYLSAGV